MNENTKTLLLVEDEAIIAMTAAGMLRDNGYTVVTAGTGEKAVEMAGRDDSIDLVLMDIDLGRGMDGTEAARLILQKHDVPVVFLSSHTEPEVVEKTEGITSYGYVVKNTGETVLLASIRMAFRLHEAYKKIRDAGARLAESEERLRYALDVSMSGTWEWDLTTNEGVWSDEIWKLYRLEPETIAPSFETWMSIIIPEDRPGTEQAARDAVAAGTELSVEWRMRDADDGLRWLMSRGRPVFDDGGKLVRYVGTVIDITRRKRAEEELRVRNAAVSAAANGIVITDNRGVIQWANPAFTKLTGYSAEEARGKTPGELVSSGVQDAEFYRRMWGTILGGEVWQGEIVNRRKDGGLYTEEMMITPVRNAGGAIVNFIAIKHDISERKRAEEILRENQTRLSEANQIMSGILENTHMMAAYLDTSFNFIWVNGTYAETCGYDTEFFKGKNHFDLYPHPENQAIFQRVVDTGKPYYVEAKPFEFPDQPERGVTYWDWSLFPVAAPGGGTTGLVFTLAEVTNRIRLENKMRLLAEMADNAPGSITVHDFNGSFLYANRRTFEIHGYTEEEFLNLDLHRLDVPESEEKLAERFRLIEESGEAEFEVAHYRKDGTTVPLNVVAKKITWGGSPAIMSIATDITARKHARHEREAFIHILGLINEKTDQRELMKSIVEYLRVWSGCAAVGIRLLDGDDFPYYETHGFPDEFVRLENNLCARDARGEVLRDELGDPVLDCMCGNVIRGRFDPSKPFFTEHGSFWSNCTTELLASTTDADRQARTRNRCNGMGYESVALIPLRVAGATFGLLQLNDKRKGRFSAAVIGTLERLCDSVAIALSHRKLVEALAESEEKFHTMVDFTYDWESWINPDGSYVYVSPSCERITGYTRDEFAENQGLMIDITHPDDREALLDHVNEMLKEDQQVEGGTLDYRILHKNGSTVWIGHRCTRVFTHAGTYRGIRISNRDITSTKQAEDALRGSEETARALLNATSESAFMMKTDGTILALNDKMAARLGRHPDELPGTSAYDLTRAETAEQKRSMIAEVVASKRPLRFEDGSDGRYYENSIYPILDGAGGVGRVAIFSADITERKRAEEELKRNAEEKAALLRELQHRIKNTLAMITSLLHLETKSAVDSAARNALDTIRGRISTLSGLYALLYASGVTREVRLDRYIRSIADSIAGAYGGDQTRVKMDVRADELTVGTKGASSIGLIVNELLMNAYKYAFVGSAGGRVTIELHRADAGIEIIVADDGRGLPEGFDPEQSEGFGLRLVRMLLEQLNGTLSIAGGKGTSFRMTLPPG